MSVFEIVGEAMASVVHLGSYSPDGQRQLCTRVLELTLSRRKKINSLSTDMREQVQFRKGREGFQLRWILARQTYCGNS